MDGDLLFVGLSAVGGTGLVIAFGLAMRPRRMSD